MTGEIKQGDVVWLNLSPTIGSEQSGIRPCIVIQSNILNKYAPTIIVIPLTSKVEKGIHPQNLFIPSTLSGLPKDSMALVNQIRTIDKKRIVKISGNIGDEIINKLTDIVLLCIEKKFEV